MTKSFGAAAALSLFALAPACTDLTEVPASAITPENFYKNEAEAIGGLASVYAQLRTTGASGNYYETSEISSDEMVVPVRGQNWGDNGQWLDIHHQSFTPTTTGTSNLINPAWNDLFTGVARANVVLNALGNVDFASKPTVVAELRVLRAFYYYMLMDEFGGVPIVTDVEIKARPQDSRDSVFRFIESELNAARPDLPATWPAAMNGRMTQGAVDAILASMYLNAEVWTGTVTTAGLQKGTARWQDAINEADKIISSGNYSLASNWRSNFTADNYNSPEIIMTLKFAAVAGLGNNYLMTMLGYNQYTPSPWNGFATLSEKYNAFDPNDIRRQIFLAGPQVNLETGAPATQLDGTPLVFVPDFGPDLSNTAENAGIRVTKWPLDPNHVGVDAGNDYGFFRLAEMYLIKAEATNELGNPDGAANIINTTTRARAFPSSPKPLPLGLSQAAMRDSILQERLLELMTEGKRRQDLIRHGTYTDPWCCAPLYGYKPGPVPPYKILMPIPQAQLETNPLLKQNPGY
ncbi:MAG: RagB/SusD family nutrient uptake outer membrane protein [Gemmatimonadaceae bacterium]